MRRWRWGTWPAGLDETVQRWQSGLARSPEFTVTQRFGVHVIIAASICGGTGSSFLLPLAADILDLYGSRTNVSLVLYLPESFTNISHPETMRFIQANAYACLKEIDHFMKHGDYTVRFRDGTELCPPRAPFATIHLVSAHRQYDKVESGMLMDAVSRALMEFPCMPVGRAIMERMVNLRDAALSGHDRYGKRCCYASFGLADRPLDVAKLAGAVKDSIFAEIIEELSQDHSTTGLLAPTSWTQTLIRGGLDIAGERAPSSEAVRPMIPAGCKTAQAKIRVQTTFEEVVGSNNARIAEAIASLVEAVEGRLTAELTTQVTDSLESNGLVAAQTDLETGINRLTKLADDHKSEAERLSSEHRRLQQKTDRDLGSLPRDESYRSPAIAAVCADLQSQETARMEAEYRGAVVSRLTEAMEQLVAWRHNISRNWTHIEGLVVEVRTRRDRSEADPLVTATRQHLRSVDRTLWDRTRRAMVSVCLEGTERSELELAMRERSDQETGASTFAPEALMVDPSGEPSRLFASTIEKAQPYWRPLDTALPGARPVEMVAIEVNMDTDLDVQRVVKSVQTSSPRDVEVRTGFRPGKGFAILREEAGISISYLADLPAWKAAYDSVIETLNEGRRTGQPQGRQPHIERQYETECEELYMEDLDDAQLLPFALAYATGGIGWDQEQLVAFCLPSRPVLGGSFGAALEACVDDLQRRELERYGRTRLTAEGDNAAQALFIGRSVDELQARLPNAVEVGAHEHAIRQHVIRVLQQFGRTLRAAR